MSLKSKVENVSLCCVVKSMLPWFMVIGWHILGNMAYWPEPYFLNYATEAEHPHYHNRAGWVINISDKYTDCLNVSNRVVTDKTYMIYAFFGRQLDKQDDIINDQKAS